MTTAYTHESPDATELTIYADNTERLYNGKLTYIRETIANPTRNMEACWFAWFYAASHLYSKELDAQPASDATILTCAKAYVLRIAEEVVEGEYDWLNA